MLVCAKCAIFGTRDRGCSAHPAVPAPSVHRGANELAKLGRNRAARPRSCVYGHCDPLAPRNDEQPVMTGLASIHDVFQALLPQTRIGLLPIYRLEPAQ